MHALKQIPTLEDAIDDASRALGMAKTIEDRRSAWELLKALIASRSQRRVNEMERERGLNR